MICSLFFNPPATLEIYPLSLHDALPILSDEGHAAVRPHAECGGLAAVMEERGKPATLRSEEHTSELQSHVNLVCRLLLEKKKNKTNQPQRVAHPAYPPQPATCPRTSIH